jgi:hypothetical protein
MSNKPCPNVVHALIEINKVYNSDDEVFNINEYINKYGRMELYSDLMLYHKHGIIQGIIKDIYDNYIYNNFINN